MTQVPAPKPPEPTLTRENFQSEVFIRKARHVAKQSLFFLYDLKELGHYPRDSRLREDAEFALHQIRSLVDGVHVPTRIAQQAQRGELTDVPLAEPPKNPHRIRDFLIERDAEPPELYAIHDTLIGNRSSFQRFTDFLFGNDVAPHNNDARDAILRFWTLRIWWRLRSLDSGLSDAQVAELIAQVQAFLRISRPTEPIEYLSMLLQKLGMLLVRNLALLVGIALLGALWLQEVLRSLVLNGGLDSARSFVPLLGAAGLALIFGHRKKWRLAKSAFFRIAFPAMEPDRGIESWDERSKIRELIGLSEIKKAASTIALLVACGPVFWFLADPTRRTLFLLACLSWAVLVALHWFDVWDFLDPRPIRLFVLSGLGFFAWGVLKGWPHEAGILLFGSLFILWAVNWWRKNWTGKVSSLMACVCLLLIVALFMGRNTLVDSTWPTAETQKPGPRIGKDDWPFPSHDAKGTQMPVVLLAASGGGSRAAIYTALTLQKLHETKGLADVGANLQAISGVSGGSLATAAYVAERARRARKGTALDKDWKPLVRGVSQDFLYPTLIGALKPWRSRGQEIERYWNDHVGLAGLTLGQLAHDWHNAVDAATNATGQTRPPFPVPLFNSCTLDGHAAVISPFSADTYLDKYDEDARYRELLHDYDVTKDDELTWVHDRDVVYPLDYLSADTNPTLSESVRASANFPFGFPLVDVRTDRPYGPPWLKHRKNLVSLTDGGVLSNSGLWSLYHLLTHDNLQAQLKSRGVLLIVVDASKMPEYSSDRRNFASLYGAIGDQDPIAQNLHRKIFELLLEEYGDALQIVKIDLIPRVDDNVYTTWALDAASQKKLADSFERVWSCPSAAMQAEVKIGDAWTVLLERPRPMLSAVAQQPVVRKHLAAAMLRPPLD